jgi:hypothetical protein
MTDLGKCCECGIEGPTVRNILMIDKRGPERGKGWGCVECGLPLDGAIAVLCDVCILRDEHPKFVCSGFPYENRRIPFEQLTEKFTHDRSKHGDYDDLIEEVFNGQN